MKKEKTSSMMAGFLLILAAVAGIVGWSATEVRAADCAEALSEGFPENVLLLPPDPSCFEGPHEWDRDGKTHSIYFPKRWQGGQKEELVATAQEAINRTLDTIPGVTGFSAKKIEVAFLVNQEIQRGDPDAFSWPVTGGEEKCRIEIYTKAHSPERLRFFPQIMAHEVFHCFQYWNLADQTTSDDLSGEALHGVIKWWKEGSAEYFSNVVYPCMNEEWEYIARFDRDSINKSILEMEYENFLFFQYLANRIGDRGIIRLLQTLPHPGNLDQQAATLAEFPDIAALFHEFGRDYLDKKIEDTCREAGKRKIRVRPQHGRRIVMQHGATEPMDSIAYFHLARQQLVFDGGSFTLEYDPSTEPPIAMVQQDGAAEWLAPPASVNTECQEKKYRLLITFAAASPHFNEYTIRETSAPEPERKQDACLVGSWRAETASAEAIGRWIAEKRSYSRRSTVSKTEFVSVQGEISASFTAGGRARGSVSNMEQRYQNETRQGRGRKPIDVKNDISVTIDGNSCADYSANGSLLQVWNVAGNDTARSSVQTVVDDKKITSNTDIDLNQMADALSQYMDSLPPDRKAKLLARVPTLEAGSDPATYSFSYRCNGDTLEVDAPKELKGAPPWRFRRTR